MNAAVSPIRTAFGRRDAGARDDQAAASPVAVLDGHGNLQPPAQRR